MLVKLIVAATGSAVIVFGTVACSSSVDKNDLAKEVSSQLASDAGREPESVTCPDDLDAKQGATTTCTLTDSGEEYGVNVTVTAVNGSDVKFDIKVDDQPKKKS